MITTVNYQNLRPHPTGYTIQVRGLSWHMIRLNWSLSFESAPVCFPKNRSGLYFVGFGYVLGSVCIAQTLPKTVVPLGMWYPFQKHSTCTKYHYLHELTTRSSLASPIARNSFCASSYNLLIVTACFSDLGRMLKSNMQGLLTNPSPKVSSEWTSGMFGFPVTGSTTG